MFKARRFERSQVSGARRAYSNSIFSSLLSQIPNAVITIILFHGFLRNMYLGQFALADKFCNNR